MGRLSKKTVKTESCVLCYTKKSKWFLDIFCEESNESVDRASIISKHLWFDLKPSGQCYVCAECWKNVYDFHLFYCKLEKIHFETNDPDSKVVEITVQPDFEFHPIDDVKLEPPDENGHPPEPSNLPTKTIEDANPSTSAAPAAPAEVRPKRKACTPDTYKVELSDSDPEEMGADDFLANDDLDFDDDDEDGDKDYVKTAKETKAKELSETPKIAMRRGRSSKNSTLNKEPSSLELDLDDDDAGDKDYLEPAKGTKAKKSTETVKVAKRRGRPPKNAALQKQSETEGEIDKSTSDKNETSEVPEKKRPKMKRKVLTKDSSDESSDSDSSFNSDKPKLRAKQTRDERLFKYIEEFFCYLCPDKVEFDRFHHANMHYKEEHNEQAYIKCTKCERKCYSLGGFINHMETHDDPEKNKCKICGKVTDQKITLKKHMRAHQMQMEQSFSFGCELCPRRFETEKARNKHERLHGRKKTTVRKEKGRDEELLAFYKVITCDICETEKAESRQYENFGDLKHHITNDHNKTAYLKCPLCSKKYVCRQQLIVHIDVHENPDHYRCEICGEVNQFLDKHKLKVHGNREPESTEKKFGCEHCGKMFRSRTNLRNHIDCVHGVKNVICEICNKPFSMKAIIGHKRTAHTDLLFMCEQCPKMFKTRSRLEAHKGDHDPELRKIIKCEHCGKDFRRTASLAKHMQVIHTVGDPVNCNLCGKQFRTKHHMMRHRANTCALTIDSRPFKCEVCGKGFAMRLTMTEHMVTHTRTSLYQCAFCFKSFGYISNLYKHRKKAHPEEWQEVQARPEQGIATVIEMRN